MNNAQKAPRNYDCDQCHYEKYRLAINTRLATVFGSRDLIELVKQARVKNIGAREILFRKGEQGRQLFVILRGRVQISTSSADGKELIFRILEPGELFGEISIIDRKERTATATTLEPSQFLMIDRRVIISFLQRRPNVTINLLNVVCERLRDTGTVMEDAIFQKLPYRLAKKLLILADSYGEKTSGGNLRIGIKLSQTQLANMIASSRESINKQLRVLEEERLIHIDSGHIVIHDLRKLRATASRYLTDD